MKHPYDIGDRVDVTSEELTVERISLLYTKFKRVANGKAVQIPNIVLNNLWIENITRSRSMREFVSVFVCFTTSFEDIKLLENELRRFVSEKEHARDYQPEVEVSVVDIAEMDKLELRVEMRYKGSWHSDAHRASRRSKFLCEVVRALREIPIYGPAGGDAPLGSESKPTYSVAVDDNWAARARRKFEEEKDRGRKFPTQDDDDDDYDSPDSIDLAKKNDVFTTGAGAKHTDNRDTKENNNNNNSNNPFSGMTNYSSGNNNRNTKEYNTNDNDMNNMSNSYNSWSGLSATLTPDNHNFNRRHSHRHSKAKEDRALELLNHPSPTDDFTRDDALGVREARRYGGGGGTATVPAISGGGGGAAGAAGAAGTAGTAGNVTDVAGSMAGAGHGTGTGTGTGIGNGTAEMTPSGFGPAATLAVHPVDQEHVRQLMRRESSRGRRRRGVGTGAGAGAEVGAGPGPGPGPGASHGDLARTRPIAETPAEIVAEANEERERARARQY